MSAGEAYQIQTTGVYELVRTASAIESDFYLSLPASVIFVSCEPLLEEVRLDCYSNELLDENGDSCGYELFINYIDQVIIGGESGSGSRPCQMEWVRSLLHQCRVAANEPAAFVKQLGSAWAHETCAKDRKGGNPDEWCIWLLNYS